MTANCFAYNGTNIFAGTRKGVFLSTDNGTNWTGISSGLPTLEVGSLAVLGTRLFVGTEDGVFLSTNNGTNWTGVNSGLVKPPEGTDVFALAILDTELFAATGQVFRSTNYGTTWTETDSGISTYDGVYSLAISGMNLFAGAYPGTAESRGGVYRSTNNGTSWTAVDSGWLFFDVGVYTFAVSDTNLFAGTNLGVFLSTNNGTSWTQANKGLTTNVYSLTLFGNNIFAGSDSGVYVSTNNGTSWTAVNIGLTNTSVYALQVCGAYLSQYIRRGCMETTIIGNDNSGTVYFKRASEHFQLDAKLSESIQSHYCYQISVIKRCFCRFGSL